MVRIAVLSIRDIINKLILIGIISIVCTIVLTLCTRLIDDLDIIKKYIQYNIPIHKEQNNGTNILQMIIKGMLSSEIYFVGNGQNIDVHSNTINVDEPTYNNNEEIVEALKDIPIGVTNLKVDDINDNHYNIGNNIEKIDIKNGTSFNIEYSQMLNKKLNLFKNNKLPTILIIHTHGSETYTGVEHTDYFRNENTDLNVVRVGKELANILSNSGYEVIHDTRLYDYPTYSGSYTRALSSIQEYIKLNDNTQIVLDIHRDAIASDENFAPTTIIDSKEVSKIMVIAGTSQGGLTHPNWEENLKLALQLYNTGYEIYPDLFRNLNITKSRYNQHATNGSLILEVGATGNTLEQSILSMRYFAKILDETLKKNWGGYNE